MWHAQYSSSEHACMLSPVLCSLPIALRSDYCHFVYVAVSNFVLPELGIVGCPVTYNPSLNEYEVNFQWWAPFSPAGLSFVRYFQITVFQSMRENPIPLATFEPEFELVNVSDGSGMIGSCSVVQCKYLTPRWTMTLYIATRQHYPPMRTKIGSTEL